MCTMIVKRVEVEGTGKGASGWFPVRQANVSYDHPFNAPMDHALNIDFVNEAQGPGARVAWNSMWLLRAAWWRRFSPCWKRPTRVDSSTESFFREIRGHSEEHAR